MHEEHSRGSNVNTKACEARGECIWNGVEMKSESMDEQEPAHEGPLDYRE